MPVGADLRDILRILSFGDRDVDEDTGATVRFTDDGYATLYISLIAEDGTVERFTARIEKEEK